MNDIERATAGLKLTADVLDEVATERQRQDAKFPDQKDLPDGTGQDHSATVARIARAACDEAAKGGRLTWRHILCEEYAEAMAETELPKLRAELVQVAAVAVKWIEWLDRRLKAELAKLPS